MDAAADPSFDATLAEQVRRQLDRVLASSPLRHSLRQQRLLRQIVEATLTGDRQRLKGYTLGVEVFDRPADFDPTTSALVRVEVGRLRGKLLEFYSGEGATDPLLIELPKGSYTARITQRNTAPAPRPAARSFDRPSIAVLPFTNMSSDPEQQYYADGITEDLITDLSKLSGLLVTSRHSSFVYRGANRRADEMARELGVRYLLEGSVRRAGAQVRISAKLIDASGGHHLWAERYDRAIADALTIQDDVTQRIVRALAVQLTPLEAARIGHEGTANADAHDLLLRGLERFWLFTESSNGDAQAWFERAVVSDPDYSAARAWLARSLMFDYTQGWNGGNRDTFERARVLAHEAVQLDGLLPFAHAMHCYVESRAGEMEVAVAAGTRAVQLDPNHSDARLFLSRALSMAGRGDEALRQIEAGMRLNPHPSAFFLYAHGAALAAMGRQDEALSRFREGTRLRPMFLPTRVLLIHTLVQLGRIDEAVAAALDYKEAIGSPVVTLRLDFLDAAAEARCRENLLRVGLTPKDHQGHRERLRRGVPSPRATAAPKAGSTDHPPAAEGRSERREGA